jgi:hypothetical protein
MREKLFFDGLAWPAARIIGRERVPGRYVSGFFGGDQPNEAETFVVDTSGNGRSYQMQYAEGWWRDLAELRTTDERQVLSFLARRGDLFGELKPGDPIRTVWWDSLITQLRQAAHAWEPITRLTDISTLRPDEPSYETAKSFLVGIPRGWTAYLDVTYDGLTPVLRAKVLAAYLTAAAAANRSAAEAAASEPGRCMMPPNRTAFPGRSRQRLSIHWSHWQWNWFNGSLNPEPRVNSASRYLRRTETALRGWGGRTRTQKCRRKLSL